MKKLRVILQEEDWKAKVAKQKASEDSNIAALTTHYKDADKFSGTFHNYTGESYGINDALWSKHSGKPSILKNPKNEDAGIGAMDRATHFKTTPKDITVYSRSMHDPRDLKNEEGIVHHPAFLSSSLRKVVPTAYFPDRNVVKKDGIYHHHIYHIDVPAGSHGVYINDKHNIDKRGIHEFVLPKGSNLKHVSTNTEVDDYAGKVVHYHTHHLKYMGEL